MEKWSLKPFEYYNFLETSVGLAEKFPFLSVENFAESELGKKVLGFTVGLAEEYVLLIGGTDAEEDFSSSLLFGFLEELCIALKHNLSVEGLRVRRALSGCAVIIIPCFNPDKGKLPDLSSLFKRIPIRHVAVLTGGRGQILLGPSPEERTLRMAEILSASTGYSYYLSCEENPLLNTFEKEKLPFIKIECDSAHPLKNIYTELREALMLLSIM